MSIIPLFNKKLWVLFIPPQNVYNLRRTIYTLAELFLL